jgi:hypothetical protein
MDVHPSRQPLIRISKTGEMRLRNKVGIAILKDNAHEERALDSQLMAIKRHQARQDKYLTYRQLEFASKQIAASEERPHTIATTMTRNESALPPIQSMNLDDSVRGRRRTGPLMKSSAELNMSQNSSDFKPQRSKAAWEKAMALVRLALQNRQSHETTEQNQTFFTQQTQLGKHKEVKNRKKEKVDTSTASLPPLAQSHDVKYSRHRRRRFSRQPSLHEMIKLSREKSISGLQDPRFLKLESCLGGDDNVRSTLGAFSKKVTTFY